MNTIMMATTILTAISVILLLVLIILYIRNLSKIKSQLLIGLLIFTALFFVQNIFALYYSLTMMDYYVPEVEFMVFIFSIFQTIAFSVMLWITWK